MDSRSEPPHFSSVLSGFPGLRYHLGGWNVSWLYEADRVVVSPGLALTDPILHDAAKKGVVFWSDIELFAHFVSAPVFAVTGTNGKTTVTTLAGAMMQDAGFNCAIGGNLGPPACDLLLEQNLDCIILELSSFQLEQTHHLILESACLLNCSDDHLDRYESFSDYVVAKQRIFKHAHHCVWNLNDKTTRPVSLLNHQKTLSFSMTEKADFFYQDDALYYKDKLLMDQHELALQGAGAIENALAACALVSSWHNDVAILRKTLRYFSGLPHRCETVFTSHGCTWYNDSKGTNIAAMMKAVECMTAKHQSVALLLGGVNKGADFSEVAKWLPKEVVLVVTFGRDGAVIAHALGDSKLTKCYATMKDAVKAVTSLVETLSLDAVLLSPACASFDEFSGYQHRGRIFSDYVEEVHHA